MKINLNDEVKVKLTEKGEEVLRIDHEELRQDIFLHNRRDIGEFKLKLDEE